MILYTLLSHACLFSIPVTKTFIEHLLYKALYTSLLLHLVLIALQGGRKGLLYPLYSQSDKQNCPSIADLKSSTAYFPHPCNTKCSPLSNSISITWEAVRNAEPQVPTQTCCINSRILTRPPGDAHSSSSLRSTGLSPCFCFAMFRCMGIPA